MTTEPQKKEVVYVCEGGCGATLSEERYHNHATRVCGGNLSSGEPCPDQGKPFIRKEG
jgi:hypothetical protein